MFFLLFLFVCISLNCRSLSANDNNEDNEDEAAGGGGGGKGEEDDLVYLFGSFNAPNPLKLDKGGEDAFYVHQHSLAVADGVGGWALQGVDPATYARSLVAGSHSFVSRDVFRSPVPLMWAGFRAAQQSQAPGSSTYCVVSLVSCARLAQDNSRLQAHQDQQQPTKIDSAAYQTHCDDPDTAGDGEGEGRGSRLLHAIASVGDSGAIVFRPAVDAVAVETSEQQHDFNFPFQLGAESADLPSDALQLAARAQVGDVVLVASDGLFDNVFSHEILDRLRTVMTTKSDDYSATSGRSDRSVIMTAEDLRLAHARVSAAAEDLARLASVRGQNSSFASPFARNAREAGWTGFDGGKMDDVTVVIGLTVSRRHQSSQWAQSSSGLWAADFATRFLKIGGSGGNGPFALLVLSLIVFVVAVCGYYNCCQGHRRHRPDAARSSFFFPLPSLFRRRNEPHLHV